MGTCTHYDREFLSECSNDTVPGLTHCTKHTDKTDVAFLKVIYGPGAKNGNGNGSMSGPLRGSEDWFKQEARVDLVMQRTRRSNKATLDAEEAAQARTEAPKGVSLSEMLARPVRELSYRIQGLLPAGGRVILAAPQKAGKTTMMGNLIRCLVDGDPFLGTMETQAVAGTVVLFDFEMGEDQLTDWLRAQEIRNTDKVVIFAMRGKGASFNILDPVVRAEWAATLREVGASFVIGDPIKPVLDVLGLSEHTEAGKLLTAFDALLADAGISEGMWTHHMGHTGERSRGDSTLRGWPDVEWKLVVDKDEKTGERVPNSPVYFWAFGRDVDMEETELAYSPEARRLTLAEGADPFADGPSRNRSNAKDRRQDEVRAKILAYIVEHPGAKTGDVIESLGLNKNRDGKHLVRLEVDGKIHEIRQGTAKTWFPGPGPDQGKAHEA